MLVLVCNHCQVLDLLHIGLCYLGLDVVVLQVKGDDYVCELCRKHKGQVPLSLDHSNQPCESKGNVCLYIVKFVISYSTPLQVMTIQGGS